ncbi:MAG: acetone carboxylase subunit gamma [Chloroflexi bacterium]|nr:acetone carboxylase subunit gamma [Chloroflexota bacterium]
MEYSKQDLMDLYDGKMAWARIKEFISRPKDDDRFEKYVEILQERMPWKERILLPIGEHLYIVQKGKDRVVKCSCGREFGDYRRNWKLSALIFVRDTREKLEEIYPGVRCPDPDFCEIREFYCAGCGTLLKVDSVPVGCPILLDFLPNLDAFYRDWLGKPLPPAGEYADMSNEVTLSWRAKQPQTVL